MQSYSRFNSAIVPKIPNPNQSRFIAFLSPSVNVPNLFDLVCLEKSQYYFPPIVSINLLNSIQPQLLKFLYST